MIEKVTLHLTNESKIELADTTCDKLNPKEMLLYAGAMCAALTATRLMEKERITPKRFEIGMSGELSTDTVQSISVFKSFHVVYNVECSTADDQVKVSRAIALTHDKYCGTIDMLRRIAPVSHEIAVVSTEPARV